MLNETLRESAIHIPSFLKPMYSRFLHILFAALACLLVPAAAQPVISEFMAQNNNTLADEDGEYSDWIEIRNTGNSAINLAGWSLSDLSTDLQQWTFPDTSLAANATLIVFASGKDRKLSGQPLHTNFSLAVAGEYLALTAPDGITKATEFSPAYPAQSTDVSYGAAQPSAWVQLAGKSSSFRYLVPNATTGPAVGTSWRAASFNDSTWTQGTLAIGYKTGASDPLGMRSIFETDVQASMTATPRPTSCYLRVPFTINNVANVLEFELRTQYDDGYATFLNGSSNPVDAANAPTSLTWQSVATATETDGNGLSMKIANLSAQIGNLVTGSNVLAIHGLNFNQSSSDFLCAPQVWVRLANTGATQWGYFEPSTPGAGNGDTESMILFDEVLFSEASKTFSNNFSLTLSGATAGKVIRYTTNGTVPTISSTLYATPINITASSVIRAKIFDSSGIGSRTFTRHFTKLAADVVNRQSNLPMVVLDPRNQTLNSVNRSGAYFQLFDRDANGVSALNRVPTLSTRQGLRWRGSSSEGQAKKPYSVAFWNDRDQEINHPLLGMNAESDWVMYAPFSFDRAYIRNAVAYEMSRRMGRWAPQMKFVEVFLNSAGDDLTANDYIGVYAICEQIKMNPTRMGYRVLEKTNIPPVGPINVLASGNWTGGYLFKIDRADTDEYSWKTTRNTPRDFFLALSRPKMENLDGGPYASNATALAGSRQVAYITSYIQAFEDALHADLANGFTTRNYMNFVDRDHWIDHLLINVFAKNVDGLRLSAFFHKPENQKIKAGPAWDFDRSMESYDSRDDAFNTWLGTGDGTDFFTRDWWNQLCQDPDFRQAFYDRWAELRKTTLSNAGLADIINPIANEIHNSANGLGSAADRDAVRWTDNAPRSGGYPAEISAMLTWLQNRAAWMERRRITDAAVLPIAPNITPLQTPLLTGGTVSLSGSGGTIYYRLDGLDPRAAGGAINGSAYSTAITINTPSTIVARVRSSTGDWSAPARMLLLAADPGPQFLPGGTASWNDDANWETNPAVYPNGNSKAAIIPAPGGEVERSVDLYTPVTMGRIHFPMNASPLRNKIRDRNTGNSFTFQNNGAAALMQVDGSSTGYVEWEVAAGVTLQDSLEIDIANNNGHPEYGALRIRSAWSGPGALIKKGTGVATLTGESKNYAGATILEQGVLRMTQAATMSQSSAVQVYDGAQIRLVSTGTIAAPAVYQFGGDIFLRGSGRGSEIPDAAGQGKQGALRYDPGTQGNLAIVTNAIDFAEAASLHVDGSQNVLELSGVLRGTGNVAKSGGGTVSLTNAGPLQSGTWTINNGTVKLRSTLQASIEINATGTLDAANSSGAVNGSGTILLDGNSFVTSAVNGLNRAFILTQEGTYATGNGLIFTENPGTALSHDIYIDHTPTSTSRYQGGYFLPASSPWESLLDDVPLRIFVRDLSGLHTFAGRTWTESNLASVTRIPATVNGQNGRILEVRFDGKPLRYAEWRTEQFPTEPELSDDAVSGPHADPTGSGIANLLRFALGLTANQSPTNALPTLTKTSNLATFRFRYFPELTNIRTIAESTSTLDDWSQSTVLFDSQSSLTLPDVNGMIEVTEPVVQTRRFYRLRIIELTP